MRYAGLVEKHATEREIQEYLADGEAMALRIGDGEAMALRIGDGEATTMALRIGDGAASRRWRSEFRETCMSRRRRPPRCAA